HLGLSPAMPWGPWSMSCAAARPLRRDGSAFPSGRAGAPPARSSIGNPDGGDRRAARLAHQPQYAGRLHIESLKPGRGVTPLAQVQRRVIVATVRVVAPGLVED